jgi:hypothetical protein
MIKIKLPLCLILVPWISLVDFGAFRMEKINLCNPFRLRVNKYSGAHIPPTSSDFPDSNLFAFDPLIS